MPFSFFKFFQFLIDNENSCYRLSSVCGIVKPYSCLKVMVKFSPAFAMNYYRRVTCLIHNQVSLVSETGKQIRVEKLGNEWEVFCPACWEWFSLKWLSLSLVSAGLLHERSLALMSMLISCQSFHCEWRYSFELNNLFMLLIFFVLIVPPHCFSLVTLFTTLVVACFFSSTFAHQIDFSVPIQDLCLLLFILSNLLIKGSIVITWPTQTKPFLGLAITE